MMQAIWTSVITATLCAALINYLSNVLSVEDLTIFYRARDQAKIGQGEFKVTFAISNMGRQGALVEEFGLFQIYGAKIDPKAEHCLLPGLLNDVPTIGVDVPVQRSPSKNMMSYHVPEEIEMEFRRARTGSVALNSGTARTIEATFKLTPFDVSKNMAIICPVVKYFDRSGRSITAVCPGWRRDGIGGLMADDIGNNSWRLLPEEGWTLQNTLFWFWRDNNSFCISK